MEYRHRFKQGDGVNTGSPAETRRLLQLAHEKGYRVFHASLTTTRSIAFSWCGDEFIGESIPIRGTMSPELFEELINPKPNNMRYEFNEGDGVYTSCKEETQKLLQLAHSKGYPVFPDSMTATNHDAFRFSKGRFTGGHKATINNRIAKTVFIRIMNQTVVETPKPCIPMINKSEVIIIPAQLQREMFAAATKEQMPYLKMYIDPFTGKITKGNMQKIYEIACVGWKTKLAKVWDWLEIKPLTIVYAEKTDGRDLFGKCGKDSMIQPKSNGNYEGKGFYLHKDYNWKIVTDNNNTPVLVPERN